MVICISYEYYSILVIKENEGWMPFIIKMVKNEIWYEQVGPNAMRTLTKNSMTSQRREKPAKVLKFPTRNIKRVGHLFTYADKCTLFTGTISINQNNEYLFGENIIFDKDDLDICIIFHSFS